MKKVLTIIAALLFATGSIASKEMRSMKANAEKLSNVKKTKSIAENYGLNEAQIILEEGKEPFIPTLKFGKMKMDGYYIAKGENDESLIFIRLKNSHKTNDFSEITYKYCNLNGNASSRIEYNLDIGTLYLNNFDELCELESGSHYLDYEIYEKQTIDMINLRSMIESFVRRDYGIKVVANINDNQKKLIKEKRNQVSKK